jgi:hypothetical protein
MRDVWENQLSRFIKECNEEEARIIGRFLDTDKEGDSDESFQRCRIESIREEMYKHYKQHIQDCDDEAYGPFH